MVKENLTIVILAAGKGTRMKSNLPKVMHKIAHLPMINYVINTANKLNPSQILLVTSQENHDQLKTHLASQENIDYVIQKEVNGTGGALQYALPYIKGEEILVLYGDVPFISEETLFNLYNNPEEISLIAFETEEPANYGRLLTNNNYVQNIVEAKDATIEQLKIKLCNSGVIKFSLKQAKQSLPKLTNNNKSKEYYLTDIVELANKDSVKVSYILANIEEFIGVNNKIDLSIAEQMMQSKLANYFMEEGVTLLDPRTVYFANDTKIGKDVIIEPNVFFGPKVEIEDNVIIRANSYLEGVKIGANSKIGPFARIRPNTELAENCAIGNFVEVKNSKIGNNSKISHLSYIGDTDMGADCNIGAGTITCNYDGKKKHKTIIEDKVFIGSNSALIAPIKIGENSLIGAGSVITNTIEPDELAVTRAKQINIKNGAKKFKQK